MFITQDELLRLRALTKYNENQNEKLQKNVKEINDKINAIMEWLDIEYVEETTKGNFTPGMFNSQFYLNGIFYLNGMETKKYCRLIERKDKK